MIRAELKNNTVWLSADKDSAVLIQRLRCASRTNKMPPLTWRMPLTYDTIDDLRLEKIPVSPALGQRTKRMMTARKYVEQQKAAEKVTPMAEIPIREGFSLFNHQVTAFNIALALFGYEDGILAAEGGGSCALFMDMGTGKSLTSVMITGRLYLDKQIKRVLVIAPSSVCPRVSQVRCVPFPHGCAAGR